jgi:hypothetical protein
MNTPTTSTKRQPLSASERVLLTKGTVVDLRRMYQRLGYAKARVDGLHQREREALSWVQQSEDPVTVDRVIDGLCCYGFIAEVLGVPAEDSHSEIVATPELITAAFDAARRAARRQIAVREEAILSFVAARIEPGA